MAKFLKKQKKHRKAKGKNVVLHPDAFHDHIRLMEIENRLKEFQPVDCPVQHEFADGVYARKMFVPAGTWVIGKRHRHDTYNIFLSGRATVYSGPGVPVIEMRSPMTFTSSAFVRKFAFFHEDSEWINIHPTKEKNIKKIEEIFIIPEEEYVNQILESKGGVLCLGQQ